MQRAKNNRAIDLTSGRMKRFLMRIGTSRSCTQLQSAYHAVESSNPLLLIRWCKRVSGSAQGLRSRATKSQVPATVLQATRERADTWLVGDSERPSAAGREVERIGPTGVYPVLREARAIERDDGLVRVEVGRSGGAQSLRELLGCHG